MGVVVTINEGFFFQILLPLRRREEGSAPPAALPPEPCPSRRAGTAGPKRRCRGKPGAPHLSLIAAERARERKLPQTRFARAGGDWEGPGPGRGRGAAGARADPLSIVGFAHRSSGSPGFPKGARVCRRRLCGGRCGATSP